MRIDDLIVIPVEPYDDVGHAEHRRRPVPRRRNRRDQRLRGGRPGVRQAAKSALRRAGLEWVEFPYLPEELRGDEPSSAVGCYANFLMVRGLVVLPSYGNGEDDPACRVIEENTSGLAVVPLDCRDLAREGGVLNCVTWTVFECRSPIASRPLEEDLHR